MTLEHFKGLVTNRFKERFPRFKTHLECLEGDSQHLGLSVFGVEKGMLSEVQELILDIDCELGISNGFVVTPLVKSLEVTLKYYPDFLPTQAVDALEELGESESAAVTNELQRSSSIYQLTSEWKRMPPHSFETSFSRAANDELALAA